MILSVGEILVDRIIKEKETSAHVGGAPFNVAVNAYRHGAKVAFIGKVGSDEDGAFVIEEGKRFLPEGMKIGTDNSRRTTVALVTLNDGERDFKFLRDNAADYALDANIDFSEFKGLNIVHLGTLMLNMPEGVAFADYILTSCTTGGHRLSVDANFRDDLFASSAERNAVMLPYLRAADVVKFSDDELKDLTGKATVEEGIAAFAPKGLMFVTCGKDGSVAFSRKTGFVYAETQPVRPVDTTGAGDAFYGTVLAKLDEMYTRGEDLTADRLESILKLGNEAGRLATQTEGALCMK